MKLHSGRSLASSLGVSGLMLSAGCEGGQAAPGMESLPVATIRPEIRIGSVDDPEYAFSAVTSLAVGPDGSIYTLHRQETTIRRWSPDGRPLGTIGGRGEGPGEFTSPLTLGWRADSLWVFDSTRNSRITFFAADGSYLGALTPGVDIGTVEQARQGIYPPRPAGLLGDGTILGMTPGLSQDIVEGRLTSIAHVRMDRDGAVLDTIVSIPVGRESVLGVLRDGGGTYSAQPFGDAVRNVLTSDGSALLVLERRAAADAAPAEFRLHGVDLSGDTVLSRSLAYTPVPIPRDSIDAAVEARAESLHEFAGERTGTTLAQWRGWVRVAMYAPAFYTPISDIVAGRDGTIWLALNPPGQQEVEWLMLDGRGEPLGKVSAPRGMRVLAADRSTLWGVQPDDLNVEYIVRYGIEHGPEAG